MAANNLDIRITASENASGVFRQVGSAAETAGQSIQRAGQAGKAGLQGLTADISQMSSQMTTAGQSLAVFGGALTALFAVSAGKSIGLESAMANFNSIAGQTDAQLAATTDQVRALSVEMGKSPTELAAGLYDIQSSGFAAADAMNILRTATIAGVAGMTSTATAGKAITAVLNAYSLEADEAANVSDVLFETVNRGVINFEQLSNNLGNTIPIAAQLGVGIEELGAAYAELTLQGVSVSQSETAIAALMRSSLNETEAMTAAVQAYGFASAEALIQSEGLAGFLTFLSEASGGSSAALLELVGTSEAMTAALGLMRNGGEDFAATLDAMNAAAQDGATTQGVFAVQSDTTAFALQRLGAAFENLQITAGNALAPLIGTAATALTSLALAFDGLSPAAQGAISIFGAFTGATALVAGGLLLIVPKVAETVSAFKALAATQTAAKFAAMSGPIVAVTAALAAGAIAWNVYNDAMTSGAKGLEDFAATAEEARLSGNDLLGTQIEEAAQDLDNFRNLVNDVRAEYTNSSGFSNLPLMPADADEAWNSVRDNILAALNDSRVDQEEYLAWVELQWAHAANVLNDPELLQANPDIIQDTIDVINNVDLSRFRSEEIESAIAADKLSRSLGDVATAAESTGIALEGALKGDLAAQRMENLNQATNDWLSNGDNILKFWLDFSDAANTGAASFSGTTAELDALVAAEAEAADFRALVQMAEDADNAAEALDVVLRTFGEIDALGQRSAQAESIATALVGEPGEWAVIDDLLANARIGIDDYNAAVSAGYSIQTSNLAVQEDLNAMRAQQLPLLAEEQAAYAAMIDQVSQLEPLEQRRALAMMDSNVQAQIATQYATAYSASLGEIPPEVATNMIVSAAEADPVLKDLLLQFGLIEEGADGTITVNFPDGPTVQESITALTESIDALVLAITGVPVVHLSVQDDATPVITGLTDTLNGLDGLEIDIPPLTVPVTPEFQWDANPIIGDGTGGGQIPIVPVTGEVQDLTITGLPETGATVPVTGQVGDLDLSGLTGVDVSMVPVTAQVTEVDTTALDGLATDTVITVTQVGMELVIGLAHATTNAVDAIPTSHATSVTESGSAGVIGLAHGATNAINAIPTSHHTSITMSGAEAAIGNAHAVANAINAIPGSRTSTITTNVVTAYSTVGTPATARALGGVVQSFAQGGIADLVTIYAAEGNRPEVAHFAGGGTALLSNEGYYGVQRGTYISPSNAVGTSYGGGSGDTYIFNIEAGDHREAMRAFVADEFIPAIERRVNQRNTALGVR